MIVRYFAGAADLAGTDSEQIPLSDPIELAALKALLAEKYPELAPHIEKMAFALNDELHPKRSLLSDDDVVDVLPPVAGGSDRVLVALRDEVISLDECVRFVTHPRAGGIATFLGVVRNHADGKSVSKLDYKIHPTLALKEMLRVVRAIADEDPELRVAAVHRHGALSIGDVAVVVAASAPHRQEAFAACRKAIDTIKKSVPIWKKEWDTKDNANWVNLD